MSKSQFILIILFVLVALLLPYGLKSAEPDDGYIKVESEPVYVIPPG